VAIQKNVNNQLDCHAPLAMTARSELPPSAAIPRSCNDVPIRHHEYFHRKYVVIQKNVNNQLDCHAPLAMTIPKYDNANGEVSKI
jgi:hypothetical protein